MFFLNLQAVIQKIDLSSADSEYVELAPSIGDSIPVIPQCEGTFPASLDKNADCATNSEIGGEQDLNLKNKKIEAICEESKKFIKNGKILVEKKNSHFDNKCVNKKGQQNESAKPGIIFDRPVIYFILRKAIIAGYGYDSRLVGRTFWLVLEKFMVNPKDYLVFRWQSEKLAKLGIIIAKGGRRLW